MSVEPVDQRVYMLAIGLSLAAGPAITHADLCRVDAGASGAGDGSSWVDAYTDLQPALTDPDCTEIWVASGLYKPGTATTDTFQLESGVALYGGFAGTESSLDERDVAANVTVLSGDVGDDDITDANGVVTDPGDQNGTGDQVGDNAEHVITAGGTDASAVLDGFTITAGHGEVGAGLYNVGGSPTLSNLTFRGNRTGGITGITGGGGLYNQGSASQPVELVATNLIFRDNFGRDGGGMMNVSNTTVSLTGSTFRNNVASSRGGAIASFGSVDLAITASIFHDNTADEGGAIFGVSLTFFPPPSGSLTVTDSTFRRNQAFEIGGAIRARGPDVVVQGSTFDQNRAQSHSVGHGDGGAIYMGLFNTAGEPAGGLFLTNSTFSENYAEYQGGAVAVECEDVILDPDAIQMNHLTFRFNEVGLQGRGGAIANLDDQTSGNISGCFDFGINNSILWLNRINSEIYNDGPQSKPVIRNSIVWRSFGSGPDWNDEYGHDGGGNLDAHPWFDHLGDRGGPTETIAIRPTSFAIDSAHPDFCPPTDQRGVPRMQDGDGDGVPGCDMGAFEVVLPTPVLGSPVGGSTGTSPIPVTIDFDLPVEEFDITDLVVGNGTAGNFAGSGDSYTVEITPDGDGVVTVDVPFGAGEWPPGGWFESDTEPSQGHPSVAAEQLVIPVDDTPPEVTLATTVPDPTNIAPVPITITFTEPVTGFELSDLGISNGTADNFSGSGDAYSVDIMPLADGAVTLDIAAGVATDAAGNSNTAAAPLNLVYDGTAPIPTLASSTNNPTNASPLPVTVTFSEPVIDFDLTSVAVDNGTAGNLVGSGAGYTFDVIPAADGTLTVEIAAGAATDAAGNISTIAEPLARTFDGTPPAVVSTSLHPIYSGLGPDIIDVRFSEAMHNPDGDIDPGDITHPANYLLVGAGNDGTFETASCADGVAASDDPFPVGSVSWNSTSLTATISLPAPPDVDDYRLFICGTTSLLDLAGNVLNGGADATAGFGVGFPITVPSLHPAGLVLLVLLFALVGSWTLLCHQRHYQWRTKP